MVQLPTPKVELSVSTAAPTLNLKATVVAGTLTNVFPLKKTAWAPCNPTAPLFPQVESGLVATTSSIDDEKPGSGNVCVPRRVARAQDVNTATHISKIARQMNRRPPSIFSPPEDSSAAGAL